jgi:hypothetical protein
LAASGVWYLAIYAVNYGVIVTTIRQSLGTINTKAALVILAAFIIGVLAGYSAIPADRVFMQNEIVSLHGQLNKSEATLAELTSYLDFVDASAYLTGYRDACLAFGAGDDVECEKAAREVVR